MERALVDGENAEVDETRDVRLIAGVAPPGVVAGGVEGGVLDGGVVGDDPLGVGVGEAPVSSSARCSRSWDSLIAFA